MSHSLPNWRYDPSSCSPPRLDLFLLRLFQLLLIPELVELWYFFICEYIMDIVIIISLGNKSQLINLSDSF